MGNLIENFKVVAAVKVFGFFPVQRSIKIHSRQIMQEEANCSLFIHVFVDQSLQSVLHYDQSIRSSYLKFFFMFYRYLK